MEFVCVTMFGTLSRLLAYVRAYQSFCGIDHMTWHFCKQMPGVSQKLFQNH